MCLNAPLTEMGEPDIVSILGQQADPVFDKIIASLGYIARRKPKPVIDSVMFWRKSKSEAAAVAPQGTRESLNADRKSLMSIYILCRVLMEVVKQCSPEVLGEDLSEKLEEIVFKQLKSADSSTLAKSVIRRGNWELFSQILGEMSRTRLVSVGDRFIAELEKLPDVVPRDQEKRVVLLLNGMKFIQLRHYPMDALEEGAEFLESLAKFFAKAKNTCIQLAYADALCNLLLPLCGAATAEFNHPLWAKAIESIYKHTAALSAVYKTNALSKSTSSNALSSGSSWGSLYKLACIALSVAPQQLFAEHWLKLTEGGVQRLKEKGLRSTIILGISRLLWVFVFSWTESLNSTTKKLDVVCKAVLNLGSNHRNLNKFWTSCDTPTIAAAICLIRVAAQGYQPYVLENVLFQLLGDNDDKSGSGGASGSGASITGSDGVCPERAIAAVQSFVWLLHDEHEKPSFPRDILSRHTASPRTAVDHGRSLSSESRSTPPQNNSQKIYSLSMPHPKVVPNTVGALRAAFDRFSVAVMSLTYQCDTILLPALFAATQPAAATDGLNRLKSSIHIGSSSSEQITPAHMDLFATLLEALPWVFPADAQLTKPVELISKHMDSPVVSESALQAILALAKVRDTRAVVSTYSKFVFSAYEKLHGSENLNATEFERVLKVYLVLLEGWVQDLRSSTRKDTLTAELWSSVEEVEGNALYFLCSQDRLVRKLAIRLLRLTVDLDRAILHVEGANGTENTHPDTGPSRVIQFMESVDVEELVQISNVTLSGPEKSRYAKLKSRSLGTFIHLAASDYGVDTALWLKAFPGFIAQCFDRYPIPVAICRNIVCIRLVGMHDLIADFGHSSNLFAGVQGDLAAGTGQGGGLYPTSSNSQSGHSGANSYHYLSSFKHPMKRHNEIIIEQWKMFLIIACATITTTDEQKLHVPIPSSQSLSTHGRKKSAQKITIHHQKITSARSMFRMVVPLLAADHSIIRDAIVAGLSCVNVNVYRTLIECLVPFIQTWRSNPGGRTNSNGSVRMITELAHVIKATAHHLKSKSVLADEWIIGQLVSFLTTLRAFLAASDVQVDYTYQKLRRYFCGVLEQVYSAVGDDVIGFDLRVQFFALIQAWCPLGPSVSSQIARDREVTMRQTALNTCRDARERSVVVAALEVERGRSESAVLKAMAGLCGQLRPFKKSAKDKAYEQGDKTSRMLSMGPLSDGLNAHALLRWVAALLEIPGEPYHVAQQALENLLIANLDVGEILYETIEKSYVDRVDTKIGENPSSNNNNSSNISSNMTSASLAGNSFTNTSLGTVGGHAGKQSRKRNKRPSCAYFTALTRAVLQAPSYPVQEYQIVTLGLFKTGDEDAEVRSQAIDILRWAEHRFHDVDASHSATKDYAMSITNRTPAVYKRAMFNLSTKFSQDYADATYLVFSELTRAFHVVSDAARRDILAVLLPWVQNNVDLSAESVAGSMVLANLFEITVVFSDRIPTEVEALWVALGGGKHLDNAKIVLDFVLHHSLVRRDPLFVEYARRVLVYVAGTPAGPALVESLLRLLTPKAMVPLHPEVSNDAETAAAEEYPFIADMGSVLPIGAREATFSHGQLSMIFLVDLIVGMRSFFSVNLMESSLAVAMHVGLVLLDHYLGIVHERARELLICICGEAEAEDGSQGIVDEHDATEGERTMAQSIEDMLNGVSWTYDDLADATGTKTPQDMDYIIKSIVKVLKTKVPDIQNIWAQIALQWATTCPVRHIACRSFQIFRSLFTTIDQKMLADMLARLSNTVADQTADIQGFAMQILMTLNAVTSALPGSQLASFPQPFWAAVACLSTIHEHEFMEVLLLVENYLDKVDFGDPAVIETFEAAFPQEWLSNNDREDGFYGLQKALIPGLRSAHAYPRTMRVLDKLNTFSASKVLCDHERIPLALAMNLPRYLHALEEGDISKEIVSSATQLQQLCEAEGQGALESLSRILVSLAKNRFRSKSDFLNQASSALYVNFFPSSEVTVLTFMLGILQNGCRWVCEETLSVLKVILPHVDLKGEKFLGMGADLISPLLRLLQTDFAEQALGVLDVASAITGSQMDKHVLRMSLGTRAMRKEYESTVTIFGIPDESGWAVPVPAVASKVTRNNVHSVFYTCASSSTNAWYNGDQGNTQVISIASEGDHGISPGIFGEEMGSRSEGGPTTMSLEQHDIDDDSSRPIQFHAEEEGYYHRQYGHYGAYVHQTQPDNSSALDDEGESLSHMWTTLDNLDSFFTRDMARTTSNTVTNVTHNRNLSETTQLTLTDSRTKGYNAYRLPLGPAQQQQQYAGGEGIMDGIESAPQLYDKKVSLILNRSLARTASTTSFKTSLADSFVGPANSRRDRDAFTSGSQYSGRVSTGRESPSPLQSTAASGGGSGNLYGSTAPGFPMGDSMEYLTEQQSMGMGAGGNKNSGTASLSNKNSSSLSLSSGKNPTAPSGSNGERGSGGGGSNAFRLESLLRGAQSTIRSKGKKKDKHDKENKKDKDKDKQRSPPPSATASIASLRFRDSSGFQFPSKRD